MKLIKPWTWLLFVLIVLDSIYTIFIGHESNPFILWVMNICNMDLEWAMVVRVFYCMIPLYIVNKYDWSRATFFCYITIYAVLSGVQFI